jgi:hypothetical protein
MSGARVPYAPTRAGGQQLAVEFVRSGFQCYMAGDVATFPEAMARGLVRTGHAAPVNVRTDGPLPEGGRLAMRYPVEVVTK